jgi:hypothetical protein
MKNKIGILLGVMVMNSTLECIEPMGKAAVIEAGKQGKELLEILRGITEKLGKDTIQVSTNIKDAANILPGASSQLGVQAANTLAKVGNTAVAVAGVGVAAYSVVQLYPIGKEIVSYAFPSEEQKKQQAASLLDAERRLKSLETQDKFSDCLIVNRLKDKSESGLPRACEEIADAMISFGFHDHVAKTAAYFKQYRG